MMHEIKDSDIGKIRYAVEDALFKNALKEWQAEKASSYHRIKLLGNPHSLAFLEAIAPLSSDECNMLLFILPKRSYAFLKEVDPNFFPPGEQRVVDNFVQEFSRLAMPFFSGNERVTTVWEEHDTLIKASRGRALQIERCLIRNLKEQYKERSDYVYATPEPHMVSYERLLAGFRIIVDFDFRHWEFFCGVKLYRQNGLCLVPNYTFLGSLGISSGPAWYVDETSALKALTVCVGHALEASHAVASVLDNSICI